MLVESQKQLFEFLRIVSIIDLRNPTVEQKNYGYGKRLYGNRLLFILLSEELFMQVFIISF